MNDRYVEVSRQGWGSRLVESIKGVLIGIVLFLVSFPLLWWNEGRAVQTAKSLQEGQANVVAVGSDAVRPENEGKLVHVAALATTQETLVDNAFGVTVQALRLVRNAEMLQWAEDKKTETKKKLGGSEEKVTTYSYDKVWKDAVILSSDFKHPEGHTNPSSMPYPSTDIPARNATLGAFHVPEEVLKKLSKFDPLPLDTKAASRLPGNLAGRAKVTENAFFIGADPTNPQVGDMRISWRVIPAQAISVVARQVGNSFAPYHAQAGDDVLLVEPGKKDAASMFQAAQEANSTLTWILRLVGFLCMAIGLTLIFRPIVVVADFIPMVGSLVSLSASIFAFLIAAPLSLLTIAVAWIAVRPLIGIALLLVALLGFGLLVAVGIAAWRKRKRMKVAPSPG